MTEDVVKYLDTYSLEEILFMNDLTEEEVVDILVRLEYIKLPDPKPVDLYDP